MRLDKFLKVSRIIKRRTVANEACSGGRVSLNGKVATPGAEVREGDVLVLCGKGHEDYQAVDGVTLYLDEHRIVHDWLCEKGLIEG